MRRTPLTLGHHRHIGRTLRSTSGLIFSFAYDLPLRKDHRIAAAANGNGRLHTSHNRLHHYRRLLPL